MQSIDSTKTYAYGTSGDLVKKKRLNIAIYKAIQKMINFDNNTKKIIKKT